ncbi:MAG: hypothetical protein WCE82_10935 [Halobacteriota archaeon]
MPSKIMLPTELDYEVNVAPYCICPPRALAADADNSSALPPVPVREKIGAVRLIPPDEVTVMLGNFS